MGEVDIPNLEELEELKAKSFTKRVALITAIFAVVLAITSLGGNNVTKGMLLSQQQASDQWAFYQSKAMREHLYRTNKEMVKAVLLERGSLMNPAARDHYEALEQKFGGEEARYRQEKAKIEKDAKTLEADRDLNNSRDPYFDYAEVLLQIAIVMSSISILSGSRIIFYFSLGSAALGSLLSLNGYLLLFTIPFFH
ncbi:MAG TPA: DUF4337 domain-containing protein [Thermodesulfovibrionales bacterium]|nr:DUF4337 domain-containing protein [Thermodesulfovibrionales bacterium]